MTPSSHAGVLIRGAFYVFCGGFYCAPALDRERERERSYTQNINTGRDFREFANPTPVLPLRRLRPTEAKRLSTGHSNLGQS